MTTASNVYIWRDQFDKNNYMIGILSGSRYYGWIPIFVDALDDCFGKEVGRDIRDIERWDKPLKINLELRIL